MVVVAGCTPAMSLSDIGRGIGPRRTKRALGQQLKDLIAATDRCDLVVTLQAKIGRAKDELLTFRDDPREVDVTINTFERKLRRCVIRRKIINCCRAMWVAEAEAVSDGY